MCATLCNALVYSNFKNFSQILFHIFIRHSVFSENMYAFTVMAVCIHCIVR